MSCTNCAMTVEKQLKASDLEAIEVDFMAGAVRFSNPNKKDLQGVEKAINQLGYKVLHADAPGQARKASFWKTLLSTPLRRFIFCLVFTLPLWLHMIVHLPILSKAWFQLLLSLPVLFTGLYYFGRSGWHSLKKGIPNMNVLVTLGSLSAFIYSLYGTLTGRPENYLFYETSATIFTLVFMGGWLESRTVAQTQSAIKSLVVDQKIMANMLTYGADQEAIIFQVDSENLKVGDLLLIKSGETVPKDCKILSGTAAIDESILTGESLPVNKTTGELLVGGSTVIHGNLKVYVTAVGKDTVLQHMLQLVQKAQQEKPPMQLLADRISAVFVPVVLGLALLGFLINYFFAGQLFTESLMRAVAVLVIACPCAMGLATPAGIAVGLGRAAKKGILFKNARALEDFKNIRRIVFDKTGTLTTGAFQLGAFEYDPELGEAAFKALIFALEKYSNHPLAKTIVQHWKPGLNTGTASGDQVKIPRFAQVEEIKAVGMKGTLQDGQHIWAVSGAKAAELTGSTSLDDRHHLYLVKEHQLLGRVDFKDTIRPEAPEIIRTLQAGGFQVSMLSGDSQSNCEAVAGELGITEFYAKRTPDEKQEIINVMRSKEPVMMVGDGINDSPALAAATVGVSLSSATQIAMQTADVLLIQQGLTHLPLALGLGRHTYLTIKQNLFWAFAYNVIAIPIAGAGLLSPSFAALAMGLSDVVLGFNSIRLRWKNVALHS